MALAILMGMLGLSTVLAILIIIIHFEHRGRRKTGS